MLIEAARKIAVEVEIKVANANVFAEQVSGAGGRRGEWWCQCQRVSRAGTRGGWWCQCQRVCRAGMRGGWQEG